MDRHLHSDCYSRHELGGSRSLAERGGRYLGIPPTARGGAAPTS